MLHNLTTSTFGPDREAPSSQVRDACAETIERLEQRVMLAASDGDVVARGDFNGDGRHDVIVYRRNAGRNGGAQLRVFVGNDDGFRRASTIQVGIVRDVAVGDFNNDGSLDLVVAQKRNEEALKKAAKGLRLHGAGADGDGMTEDEGGGDNGGGAINGGGTNAGEGGNGGNAGEFCGSANAEGAGADGLRTLAVGDDGDSDQEPVDGDGDRDDEDPDDGDGGPNNGPGDDDDDAGQDDDSDEDDDNDQDGNGIDDDEEVEGERTGGGGRRRRDPVDFDTEFGFPRRGRGGNGGADGANDGRNRGNTGKGLRGNAGSLTILMGNGNGTFDAARMVASNVFGVSRIRVGDFNDDGDLDLRVRARNIDAEGETIKGGGKTTITFFGEGDGTFRRGKSA